MRRINYSPRPTNLLRVKFERVLNIIAQNLADKSRFGRKFKRQKRQIYPSRKRSKL
ncbi:hypothetical protein CSUNSWCD_1845 [Campylobacter showae CSUNSWCD]|uniref:Uncharacterized protein n=1 Tax=Campylobacter showae CSUNSWCD TaxID=1244083 RepID=M5IPZ5_9BACT|nr:hypothetical protein CSUNSWCD_1845 [Campylobacter showae CSUNSWCD]